MPEGDGALIIEILRKLQAQQTLSLLEMGELKTRMTILEEAVASVSGHVAMLEASVAGIHKRLDRQDNRLDRMETRLGLIEA